MIKKILEVVKKIALIKNCRGFKYTDHIDDNLIELLNIEESYMDNSLVELSNIEIHEYCLLNINDNKIMFYFESKDKSYVGSYFKGLYFRDEYVFFALYPTEYGPMIYYQGKKYAITPNLEIKLVKKGQNRSFYIKDYGLKIKYKESPYIDIDIWSEEIDVDLFYRIEQLYKTKEFYERYTKPAKTNRQDYFLLNYLFH